MIIIIESVRSKLLIGGSDHLVDPVLIDNLREYMAIDVPGSFFANRHLKWHWNGKRYFLTKSGIFATGFFSTLLKYIDETYPDLEVKIVDKRENVPCFKVNFVNKIGDQTAYEHQENLIKAFNHRIKFRDYEIYSPQGVVDAATNSGKTLVMAGVYLNLENPGRMLIIIHRKTVYRELVQYFESIFGEVGQINDQSYTIGKEVTIAMIQTLYRHIDQINVLKDLARFNVLACDEVHYSGAPMYSKVLVHCPAAVRMGLSGTAIDSELIISKMVVVGLFGPRLIIVSKKQMIDKGISAPVTVYMHLANTILHEPVMSYDDYIHKLIYESAERINIIAQIIKDRSDVLIAVDKIYHGEFIQEQLRQRGLFVEITHSKDRDIESKIEDFKEGRIPILISTGVLKEGVNIKRLKVLIYCIGNKSKISAKQWMGRIERLHESKEGVEFHDFMDIGRFVNKYSLKRLKMYYDENLPVMLDFDLKSIKKMHSAIVD